MQPEFGTVLRSHLHSLSIAGSCHSDDVINLFDDFKKEVVLKKKTSEVSVGWV